MTDRPVYRPEHKIQFKAWVRHAKYDQADALATSPTRTFDVIIRNPKGDKIYEKILTTDAFARPRGRPDPAQGRHARRLPHPDLATKPRLRQRDVPARGVQEARVRGQGRGPQGAGPPRREDRGDHPGQILLRRARSRSAKVKYKVTAHAARQRLVSRPGRGTGSTAPATGGSPPTTTGSPAGASGAASVRSSAGGGAGRNQEPPEVVLENEVQIGPDGIVKVTIDTAAAKELHGDQDHCFSHHRRGRG